jgi:hypothetical protein
MWENPLCVIDITPRVQVSGNGGAPLMLVSNAHAAVCQLAVNAVFFGKSFAALSGRCHGITVLALPRDCSI